MIERDNRQRNIMVISDHPLENEIKRGVPYCEPSQTSFKDALNAASIKENKKYEDKFYLNSSTICYTYLSTERYKKGDFDWATSIVSKKNIPNGENYYQIEHLKDVWVSPDIWYPWQDLLEQIRQVQPKLIICAGKWAFFFLGSFVETPEVQVATIATTKSKPDEKKMFGVLNKFRSSIMTTHGSLNLPENVLVPILTPAYLFLVKDRSFAIEMDYRKLARIHRRLSTGTEVQDILKSPRNPQLGLSNIEVFQYLNNLLKILDKEKTLVSMDVETRQGSIDCIGLAYEENFSLTIPFSYLKEEINEETGLIGYITKNKVTEKVEVPVGAVCTKYFNYWSLDDEIAICNLLWKVMLHPNCLHVGQNYNYDCQWYWHLWKLSIYSHCDTMILHHVLYNYMQKDLSYLSSIYCSDHVYWKDQIEVKDNHTRWRYNGRDCMYTLTVAKVLLQIIKVQKPKLQEFYQFQQFQVVPKVVTIMNRGVKVDVLQKDELNTQFSELMQRCIEKINYIFLEDINLNSTPQVKRAFKDLLGIKPVLNRKTKRESFGSDAMLVYLEAYPEWRTLLTLFLEYKSIKVFVRTFLSAKVDSDGNMRCSYNPAGTKTYRFSSRKNVFGNGMNLANVPSKGKIDLRVALQEYANDEVESKAPVLIESDSSEIDTELMLFDTEEGNIYEGTLKLPNCKKIFLPSTENHMFFNADYSGADAMVVAADSECKWLLDFFNTSDKKLYVVIASEYLQEEISTYDPRYKQFKAFIHGTNYGMGVAKAALTAGMSIVAAQRLQQFYFKLCPEIPHWHQRIQDQIRKFGYIENCFGARFWFTDLNDPTWTNKAYASIPQSTIAILCNKGLVNIEQDPNINVLMQIHDAIAGEFLITDTTATQRIKQYMEIPLPYENAPITIPIDIETSILSYGDCH